MQHRRSSSPQPWGGVVFFTGCVWIILPAREGRSTWIQLQPGHRGVNSLLMRRMGKCLSSGTSSSEQVPPTSEQRVKLRGKTHPILFPSGHQAPLSPAGLPLLGLYAGHPLYSRTFHRNHKQAQRYPGRQLRARQPRTTRHSSHPAEIWEESDVRKGGILPLLLQPERKTQRSSREIKESSRWAGPTPRCKNQQNEL